VFGDLLRRRRLEQKRRVDDVAAAVKVTPSYLRMLESGKRAPAPDKALGLLQTLDVTTRSDERADLIAEVEGRRWVIEFKHWAAPAATVGLALGAILGGPLSAVAGAAAGSRLSELLSDSRRHDVLVEGVNDAEIMGLIVQRVSTMGGEQLRDLWAALNAIGEAHARTNDDAVVDARNAEARPS
jgi:transcriptional regulator with XRE-family HTH domain